MKLVSEPLHLIQKEASTCQRHRVRASPRRSPAFGNYPFGTFQPNSQLRSDDLYPYTRLLHNNYKVRGSFVINTLIRGQADRRNLSSDANTERVPAISLTYPGSQPPRSPTFCDSSHGLVSNRFRAVNSHGGLPVLHYPCPTIYMNLQNHAAFHLGEGKFQDVRSHHMSRLIR